LSCLGPAVQALLLASSNDTLRRGSEKNLDSQH
jgi:hypothetical protein